ncbi:bifunctional pyr operon transcriptional regulator/uracil phosphoribosyltransferase PyrR [Arcanobacterium haemolyticum]|nr:bifunctional pyr operon transcriptional regulator/uracil phosphoribosyltransferase PyrR [Arcanobacterium haemolyticum]
MADEHRTRAVMEADDISRSLRRIAHEILERNKGGDEVVLLGIPTRGVPLAHRLHHALSIAGEGLDVPVGTLDITMYRDDLAAQPTRAMGPTVIPSCGLGDKIVVLVDDVIFSGRTIRSALEAISDIDRPRAIQLAVLVDRGHRELPIRADFVGKNLPTARDERVKVALHEIDGRDGVLIEEA